MANKLTKAEKETILLTSEADDTWQIYTFNTAFKSRLRSFSKKYPEACQLKDEDPEAGSVTYILNKASLSNRLLGPCSQKRRQTARETARQNGFMS